MSDEQTHEPDANNPRGAEAGAAIAAPQPEAGKVEATAPAAASTASPGGESAPPAAKGEHTAQDFPPPERAFVVTGPKKEFTGRRGGLDYKNGVATTDDPIAAHAAMEIGCSVLNRRTQKAAFDSDAEGVAEKLAERAKNNW